MNRTNANDPTGDYTPDSTELLRQLCERQTAELQKIRMHVEQLESANGKLSGDLLRQSKARQEELQRISVSHAGLRHVIETVAKQRDVIEQSLRSLRQVCGLIALTHIPDRFLIAWSRELRTSAELLKVIDDAKAAASESRKPE